MGEVIWRTSGALVRRLGEIQAAGRPGSRAIVAARKDIRQIGIDDHKDKIMRSVDRYGKPLVPLRSGRKVTPGEMRRRGGPGPVLAPHGLASRVITALLAVWTTSDGVAVLRIGWSVPWMIYHVSPGPRRRTRDGRVRLPRRDVAGITPRGWRQITERHKALAGEILRAGGGR